MIDTMQERGDGSERRARMRALSMPDLMDLKDVQAFDEALFSEQESNSCKPEVGLPAASSTISLSSLLSPSSSTLDLIALTSRAMSKYHPLRVFSLGMNRSMSLPRESTTNGVPFKEQKSSFVSVSSPQAMEDDPGDFFMPFDDDISACSNDDTVNSGRGSSSTGYLPRFYSAEKLSTLIPPTSKSSSAPEQNDSQIRAKGRDEGSPAFAKYHRIDSHVESSSKETNNTINQERLPIVPRDFTTRMHARDVAVSHLEDFFMGRPQGQDRTHPSPQSVTALHPSTSKQAKKKPLFSLASFRCRERSEVVSGTNLKVHSAQSETKPTDGSQSAAAIDTTNHRSIIGNEVQESRVFKPPLPVASKDPAPKEHDEDSFEPKEFVMLRPDDRANSMPKKMPSSGRGLSPSPSSTGLLPRRSSLKKISSLRSIASNAGDNRSTSSTGAMKRNVSFSNLSIREYEVTLGDNPSCSMGPPISLGWEYRDTAVLSLEEFETKRKLHFPRRNSSELMLSYNVRRYLLLKTAGYTKAELREAIKEVERIKRERKVTDMFMPACMLDEVMEDVVERMKSMFGKQENKGQVSS